MSVKLNQILLKLQQTQIRLKQMATRDPLTNLPNRVLMLENIDIAIQAAERDHKKFTFLFINLNRFKTINDSLGHAIGDLFLMRIAKVLLAAVGDQGLVSRIGGDEFAILTNNITTPERAAQFVNHIMLSLNQPMQLKEHCLHPTASIGVSIYPDDAQTAEELIHNADIAMYNAKDPGYANWAFFKPQMTERANQRLRIEADLHHSLENNEFILYFQPQFDLQTAQIKGCEALLRCKKTDQLIMPTSFIQTAEETGIIIPIGRWVIEEACKMIKHWQQQYQCQIPIAVNLSSRQFEDKHLLTTIKNLSEKYQISPSSLEIEITETSIMKDLDMAIYKLQQLKNAGFSIALDDFGTGYSSLAYLRHLPISTLKIDREFVRDLPENNALASTILTLGNKLDLHIVAEGIEHDKQYQWLRQHDCQTGQGFYFNQPLSQADFEEKYIKH